MYSNIFANLFSMFPLHVFLLCSLLLISGCSTSRRTGIAAQWPLQAGIEDVYQYYEGEPLPPEEVAILDIRNPLSIMKQISPMALTAKRDYYYSGKFALKPGKQTISLSYLRSAGVGHYSSIESVEVPVVARKGRLYRTFCIEGLELYLETKDQQDINRFYIEIYDVSDREALSGIIKSGRFEAFRREAKALLQQIDGQVNPNPVEKQ